MPLTPPFSAPVPRTGLTVLGLVIVIVAIGVLLAVVIEVATSQAERKYDAIARADLERLALAEQKFFSLNRRYVDTLTQLGFVPTEKVTVAVSGMGLAFGTGWGATARHAASPDRKCVIGFGADTVIGGIRTKPGIVTCR